MTEVYLEVHASPLRERAAALRTCGHDLERHVAALTSSVPHLSNGPWAGAVVAPSAVLTGALENVARALSGGLRAVDREAALIAHAMLLAAERYRRSDVLPGPIP